MSSPPDGCVVRCPACPHRNFTKEESLQKKQDFLSRALSPWSHLIEPIQSPSQEKRWFYREKICLRASFLPGQTHLSGAWDFGVRLSRRDPEQKKSKEKYDFIGIKNCPIHSQRIQKILLELSVILPPASSFPLHFIAISGSLVTLVLKTQQLPDFSFIKNINFDALGIQGLFANLNPACGQRVFSSRGWTHLWGQKFASLQLNDHSSFQPDFQYGPNSFQQLIPELFSHALLEALRFFAINRGDKILDLYSGIGTSLALWNSKGAQTLGVELNGESVECAKKNCLISEVLRGRISNRRPQITTWAKQRGGAEHSSLHLFANPPRMGFEPGVLAHLAQELSPQKIAYQSCSPGTLARDLSILSSANYKIIKIKPYDFFPQTRHVEVLVFLERRN